MEKTDKFLFTRENTLFDPILPELKQKSTFDMLAIDTENNT